MKILFAAFLFLAFSAEAQLTMPLTDFKSVAASQTGTTLGPVGGKGDIIQRIMIIPETVAAGTVTLLDGGASVGNVFVAGTLTDLHPILIELGARSVSGSWSITTGANVHVIAVGRFK